MRIHASFTRPIFAAVVLGASLFGASSSGAAAAAPAGTASADAWCSHGDGVLDVTLYNNDAGAPVQFTVTNPVTKATSTVEVAASDAYAITYTGLADGPVTVAISAGGVDRSVGDVIACDVAQGDPGGGRTPTVENHLPATGAASRGGLVIASTLVGCGALASLAARRRADRRA
ncbi:unnamed protein product [Phaeothamnion confervicola]